MALLSVVLFGGLRFGVRAWESGSGYIEQASRIEAVQSLLRRQVGQAQLPRQDADAEPLAAFAGDTESLTFIAPLPVQRGIGGWHRFRLALREDGGHADLALAWRPYRAADNLDSLEDATTLLEDIAGMELSYFGALDEGQPMQWWDGWESASGRPQLVRLRLEFPPGDPRRWPDLVIRVIGSSN